MKKFAKMVFVMILMFSVVACSQKQDYEKNREEYNATIDELFKGEGFKLTFKSSTYLSENEADLSGDILKDEYLLTTQESLFQIDLSDEKTSFILSAKNQYSKTENDIEETLILSKNGTTKNFIKYKDEDFEETLELVNSINEFNIEESIKDTMFYIRDDIKDDYEVSKEEKDDNVIYTITLKKQKDTNADTGYTIDNFVCKVVMDKKQNLKKIDASYVMSNEDSDDVYHRTGFVMNMKVSDIDQKQIIDYSLLD